MRIERPSNRISARARRVAFCVAFMAFVCVVRFVFAADQPAGNTAKGFESPLEFYPAPHERQPRSYLEAAESEIGQNSVIVLHGAVLRTFHEDGSREMVVSAPLCFYDYAKRTVNSTGALHFTNWDEAHKQVVQVWGTNGFYWQQTNSFFVVSNQQATRVTGASTNSIKQP